MKKIFLLAVLAVLVTPAMAQQQTYRFTLEELLDYAMGNSYVREQMELSQKSLQLTYDQSKMERLPDLSASAGENFGHSRTTTSINPITGAPITNGGSSWGERYGVSTGVTLYQGGTLNNTIERNKLLTEEAGVRTAQYDNTLAINILSSYFSILGFEELLKYQQSLIAESEEQVEQGRARLVAGTILPSDYLLLESQLATNKNNISDTNIKLENELLTLKALLSMDMDTALDIISPDEAALASMTVIPQQSRYLERAVATMPDFDLLDYGVEIAEKSVSIARGSFFPTVGLSGSLATGGSWRSADYAQQIRNGFSQSAGLSLSIPIFTNHRNKTNVARSRIQLQQAELDRKQTQLDLEQTLIQSYRNVEGALNQYRTLGVRENAYRETFRVYSAQFDAGSITAVDLLQQQNNYISVMYDYVQSKYGFMLRRKILDVYMGLQIKM